MFARWRRRTAVVPLVAGLLALAPAAPLSAAIEGFLKVGTGSGEATDPAFADWSNAFDFNWGGSRSGTTFSKNDLNVTKTLDRTSPSLLLAAFKGQFFPDGHLVFRNVGESVPALTVNLTHVFITSLQHRGTAADGRMLETVALSFDTMELTVTGQIIPGATVTTTSTAWNFATAAKVTSTPPTVTIGAAGQTTPEDTATTVSLALGDDYSPADLLSVTARSSNVAVIYNWDLVLSGTGAARTLELFPSADASGTSTITVTVRDTSGLSVAKGFTFTVTPVNDAPVVAPVSAQVATVGQTLVIPVALSDVDSAAGSLSVTATSGNLAVLPSANVVLGGSGLARTLTVTPTTAGQSTVTLTASDGQANSAPVQFVLSVNSSAPTDITLSPGSVPENSATGTVVGELAAVDPDATAGHTFELLDDAGGSFKLSATTPTKLLVADGSLLDFEQSPTSVIVVRATATGGASFFRSLTIAIGNVNEAPVIAIGVLGEPAPGAAHPLTTIAVADVDGAGAPAQTTFSVLFGRLGFDATGGFAGQVTGSQTKTVVVTAPLADLNAALAAGRLSYVADATFGGDELLKVECSDLGQSGTGGAQADARVAAFSVRADRYAAWKAAHFTADETADAAVSGDPADPDGDTLANLLEFALGSDPRNAAGGLELIVPTTAEVDGVRYPAFRYVRRTDDPRLLVTVEVSTDVAHWASGANSTVEISREPLGDHTERVFARSLQPLPTQPNQQMRLRATRAAVAP